MLAASCPWQSGLRFLSHPQRNLSPQAQNNQFLLRRVETTAFQDCRAYWTAASLLTDSRCPLLLSHPHRNIFRQNVLDCTDQNLWQVRCLENGNCTIQIIAQDKDRLSLWKREYFGTASSHLSVHCTLWLKHSLSTTPVKTEKLKTKAQIRKATNTVLSHLRMEALSIVTGYAKYAQNSYVQVGEKNGFAHSVLSSAFQ